MRKVRYSNSRKPRNTALVALRTLAIFRAKVVPGPKTYNRKKMRKIRISDMQE